jgi:hypothetical protein
MGSGGHELNAHEQPSTELRAEWKSIVKLTPSELADYTAIDDPRSPVSESGFRNADPITQKQLEAAFSALDPSLATLATKDSPVIYHPLLPGKQRHSMS